VPVENVVSSQLIQKFDGWKGRDRPTLGLWLPRAEALVGAWSWQHHREGSRSAYLREAAEVRRRGMP
jgi:hypothetical protein